MIHWGRFALGVAIATVICFVSDGFLHEGLISAHWQELYAALNAAAPTEEGSASVAYFALFELGRAFIAMLFYVLLRARTGPGVKTAAIAGTLSWVAFSLTGPAQMIPLGLFSHPLWLRMGAVQLLTSLVASIAGAAPYKE